MAEFGRPPHARAVPLPRRPLSAADQGPFDWIVPFIPPFLRVNRATRELIWTNIQHATSPEALQQASDRLRGFLREHGAAVFKYLMIFSVWVSSLYWVHSNIQEFAMSYVILSGFAALGLHLYAGGGDAYVGEDGERLSAYSVFNKGARRMMGSLSAEQFENEIRHRGPHHIGADELPQAARRGRGFDSDEEEEDDPDMLEALRQSLEEKKREERRLRRTRRR